MPLFKIPDRYRPGLAKLFGVTDAALQELLRALSETPPTLNHEYLSEEIASKVHSISKADINDIILTVFSLYIAKGDSEVSIPDFVKDIWQAIDRGTDRHLALSGEQRERATERLVKVLSLDSLNIGSKALDLSHEYEHVLCSLRIVTDMRPVWSGSEIGGPPRGAVIVHTLKIIYHQESELKEFFVALDTSQVELLRDVLRRADQKARHLKMVLDKAEVEVFRLNHKE